MIKKLKSLKREMHGLITDLDENIFKDFKSCVKWLKEHEHDYDK